ncbi:MAG: hypothetical protein ACRC5M_06490 [Anaeroplasmataceae bacterium]
MQLDLIKIIKVDDLTNDLVNIHLSNNEVLKKIDIQLMFDFKLYTNNFISNNTLLEVKEKMLINNIYTNALKYAAKSIKCSFHIRTYLLKKTKDVLLIDSIIEKLKSVKLLNDDQFLNDYFNKLVDTYYGINVIESKLTSLELSNELLKEKAQSVDSNLFIDKGIEFAKIKIMSYKSNDIIQSKTKIYRLLVSRGYLVEEVNLIIEKVFTNE